MNPSAQTEVVRFLQLAGLSEYAEQLVGFGYDTMDALEEMEERHMREAGLRPGHALLLRRRLRERSAVSYKSARSVPGFGSIMESAKSQDTANPFRELSPKSASLAVPSSAALAAAPTSIGSPKFATGIDVSRYSRLARSSDEHIRRVAVDVLCGVAAGGDSYARAILQDLAATSEDEHVRHTVAQSLGQPTCPVLPKSPIQVSVSESSRAVNMTAQDSQGPGICEVVVDGNVARRAVSESCQAVGTFVRQARNKDEHTRRVAAQNICSLANLGDRQALEALPELAGHDDEEIRRSSVDCLCRAAENQHDGVSDALEELIGSGDEYIRRAAASALYSSSKKRRC
eukprot:TRINITY_DN20842_c0_g2_i1.p1 TRINITY_DN20842_c0_g2~~TRINITY_DN20842_c0_g2_i1.p1  ORF type:complete len:344 (+),score=57.46 TRINITY_DN20842_c0_g2_i1:149-1180(+)